MEKIKLILEGCEYELLEDVLSAEIKNAEQCTNDSKALADFRRLLKYICFQELANRISTEF